MDPDLECDPSRDCSAVTVKYGPDGVRLWASKEPARLPGGDDVPGSGDVVLGNDALAVDDHGNAYLVGSSQDVLKSSPKVWAKRASLS